MRRWLGGLAVAWGIGLLAAQNAVAQSGWLEELWKELSVRGSAEATLDTETIAAGLREALAVGTQRVVDRLGAVDGFNADPSVHIPLPRSLADVRATLDRVGMAGYLDDLELRLNRAAEAATPRAKRLFVDSIRAMTIDDVVGIYEGPDDAATRYFRDRMSQPLAREMAPIVDDALSQVGAIRAYEDAMQRYNAMPFVPDVRADLTAYVVEKGMDGIFHYLAKEEAAIRRDPVKRSTELLEKVFGADD